MILKYYTNGWNYNEVFRVQIFNLRTDELNKEIAERKRKLKLANPDEEDKKYSIEDYRNDIYVLICNRIDSLAYYHKTKVKVHLTEDFYNFCFRNRDDMEYIRCVSYSDENDEPSFIAYQGSSYLMNNDGKTLETISNERQITHESGGSSDLKRATE